MHDHRAKRLRRATSRVARRDGARCILEQGRELRGGFGRKIVAGEIEVHDILHFVCAAHHGPRWRTCIRTAIADASPVIATNVEKARDHHPALHHAQARADRFDNSADHVVAMKRGGGQEPVSSEIMSPEAQGSFVRPNGMYINRSSGTAIFFIIDLHSNFMG